ncbi:MAG: hypothetical protein ACD_7C00362G0010 [uncultured bacterium]|nr:MAG: hypothetical protein ACD_7C00362G0010 [uncultured bacterium]OGO86501.1 MAG: hypothetical protein A2Y24_08210 [Clostridiales bacterium GWE2_32_10]
MENIILKQLGLNDNQILIYEYLLANGAQKASVIAKNTPLQRGVVYKTLDELIELKIIEKNEEENAIALFIPLHPSVLKSLAESKIRTAQNTFNHLESEIGSLISMYNLTNNKPGIEFYEGIEGVKKILSDSLTARETIYSYADFEAIEKNISQVNAQYRKKRNSEFITKKGLALDTPFAREFLKNYPKIDRDNVRLIPKIEIPFSSVMQIYDKKISYISFNENSSTTSIIITDPNLYAMHRYLFESLWNTAKSLDQTDSKTTIEPSL